MSRTVIAGTGSQLPVRVLTNVELEGMVETSDEWITTRTGIKTRRIAGPGESTSQLAAAAGRKALAAAGLEASEIGGIIVATITPDMSMPSCACLVQKELGATSAFAFDLNAACSGFVYALEVADRFVRTTPGLKILVIGAETLSGRVNWQDRNTCVLFGDGAGACVVQGSDSGSGILASRLYADGSLWELLNMEAAPSRNPALVREGNDGSYIRMVGRDVFRYAVRAMGQAVDSLLAENGVVMEDVALLIPHQANIRILRSLMERLEIGEKKVFTNVQRYGNTSAASVPIALDEAVREGRLQRGDLVLFCVFGGGFTWGAMLLRW